MPATLNLAAVSAFPPMGLSSENRVPSARFHRRSSIRAAATATAVEATPATSLYEVLRVEHNASPTEIKSAYRTLAKLYHPDAAVRRSPESGTSDFIAIRNAYETLSDPSARAMYDISLGRRRRSTRPPLSVNRVSGFYQTRKWETDQCW